MQRSLKIVSFSLGLLLIAIIVFIVNQSKDPLPRFQTFKAGVTLIPTKTKELQYKPKESQVLSWVRINGPAICDYTINGQPLIVASPAEYVKKMKRAESLAFMYRNFTFDVPFLPRLDFNSNSLGWCDRFSMFYASNFGRASDIATAYILGLSRLHSIIAIKNIEESNYDIIDPSLILELGTYNNFKDVDFDDLDRFFTADGYLIPSGLAKHYYLMGFGKFAEVEKGFAENKLMTDHHPDWLKTRLAWVKEGKVTIHPVPAEPTQESSLELFDNQSLILSSRPIKHPGLAALNRPRSHYFKTNSPEPLTRSFSAIPSDLFNGRLELSMTPELQHHKLELPFYSYAIEIWGNQLANISGVFVNDVFLPCQQGITNSHHIVPIIPPAIIKTLELKTKGPISPEEFQVDVYFLVHKRIANLFLAEREQFSIKTDQPSLENIELHFDNIFPRREPGYGKFLVDGFDVRFASLFDQSQSTWTLEYRVIKNEWLEYTADRFGQIDRFPDLLDHPVPKFVPDKDNRFQEIILQVILPSSVKSVRVGSLALVSSFENDISVYLSDDGHSYVYAYSHKPGMISNYQEYSYVPSSSQLFIKVVGLRKSKLYMNDYNYVSLSHLFLFAD